MSSRPTEPPYVSTRFEAEFHNADHFTCGEPGLDTWLANQASAAMRARTATTFVWVDQTDSVQAYYSLSAHALRRNETSSRIGRGMPQFIPAALIGKLALHINLHGNGLGQVLLTEAITRIIRISHQGPAVRAIVVDAATPAGRRLYSTMGFTCIPGQETRMVARASAFRELGA